MAIRQVSVQLTVRQQLSLHASQSIARNQDPPDAVTTDVTDTLTSVDGNPIESHNVLEYLQLRQQHSACPYPAQGLEGCRWCTSV